MKTLGIIGGIAPESTIDYYRSIIAIHARLRPDGSQPRVIINSIDLQTLLGLVTAGELDAVVAYLLTELTRLARAGCDMALLASNTPHLVFDVLQQRSPIPLISLVEAACAHADALGLRRVGLLGTRFTMLGRFYPDVFQRADIAVVVPDPDDLERVHRAYIGELIKGVFVDATRTAFLAVIDGLVARHAVDGVILGGTEIPLLLRRPAHAGVPLLDTTAIHAEAAVAALLAP